MGLSARLSGTIHNSCAASGRAGMTRFLRPIIAQSPDPNASGTTLAAHLDGEYHATVQNMQVTVHRYGAGHNQRCFHVHIDPTGKIGQVSPPQPLKNATSQASLRANQMKR